MCLSFQPRCVYRSQKKRGEKNHTRQKLISQAANSHSRWPIFSPSKMKGQNESSDLICALRRNTAHEIVFSFRRFTLSLWISQLLFYFIYPSFDVSTSTSLWLHRAPPPRQETQPVAWSSSGLVPQGLFHSCDHYTFFSMLSWGNKSFLSVKVFLVKILHFLTSISPFYIALLDSQPRGTAVPCMRKYLSNIHEFGWVQANYNIKSRISLKCPHLK